MRNKLKGEKKFDARLEESFLCSCSDSPPPPNYEPLAEASEETARIMADLGREQLAFAREQYERNYPLYQAIVEQQRAIADETLGQGRDYYEYLKQFRPAELAMLEEAMRDRTPEYEALRAQDEASAALIAGSDVDVYNARRAQIDALVNQAIADAQSGYTRSVDQAIRQGLRYGLSPAAIASQASNLGIMQASQTAAAANAARQMGIERERALAQAALGLRRDIIDTQNRLRAADWAKKLDVSGLVRGLPGASQGAYGLAIGAGTQAGQNAALPGQQYLQGMGQGANTIATGRQLYQQGLGNVLAAQADYARAVAGQDNPFATILGTGLGYAVTRWP